MDVPLIQGLLGTSRTFLGLPYILNKPPKSWLGRNTHLWKELSQIRQQHSESQNCTNLRSNLEHPVSVLDEFYVYFDAHKILYNFVVTTFSFDALLKEI